ncbi:hypothetical protein LTS18_013406, partial [Coniosporium uncinatum]
MPPDVELRFPTPNEEREGNNDPPAPPPHREQMKRLSKLSFRSSSREPRKSNDAPRSSLDPGRKNMDQSRERPTRDELAHIADFGTVAESLGGSPYDIATSAVSPRPLPAASGMHPHQISTLNRKPSYDMSDGVASAMARARSRDRNAVPAGPPRSKSRPRPKGIHAEASEVETQANLESLPEGQQRRRSRSHESMAPMGRGRSLPRPKSFYDRNHVGEAAPIMREAKRERPKSVYTEVPPVPPIPAKNQLRPLSVGPLAQSERKRLLEASARVEEAVLTKSISATTQETTAPFDAWQAQAAVWRQRREQALQRANPNIPVKPPVKAEDLLVPRISALPRSASPRPPSFQPQQEPDLTLTQVKSPSDQLDDVLHKHASSEALKPEETPVKAPQPAAAVPATKQHNVLPQQVQPAKRAPSLKHSSSSDAVETDGQQRNIPDS